MRYQTNIAVLLALVAAAAAKCPSIDNFTQTTETETSVTVTWTVNLSEEPVLKYSLTINDLLTQEFLCSTASCSYMVSGLGACGSYSLHLVAVCAGPIEGPPGDLIGTTSFSAPGAISDIADDGTVVTWTPPSNVACVGYYEVCYTSSYLLTTTCVQESTTTFNYTREVTTGCDSLIINVKGMTPNGVEGPATSIEVESAYGLPGQVRNYEVSFTSDTDLLLLWDTPLENPGCIKDYSIVYGPEGKLVEAEHSTMKQEHVATLTNLDMCSLYLVEVAALSIQNVMGPPATEYMQTAEIAPELIPNVVTDPNTDSIDITWGNGSPDACLANIKICVSDPVTEIVKCDEIGSTGTGNGNYTVTGLSPCRGYTFVIEGVSPGGITGPVYSNTTYTEDVAPGPVENLAIESVSQTSIGVGWDKPLEFEECVSEYVISYTNMFENSKVYSRHIEVEDDDDDDDDDDDKIKGLLRSDYVDSLTGLSSCVDYRIEVYGISYSGLKAAVRTVYETTFSVEAGAPTSLQLVEADYYSVTVLWYAPDDKYCVEHYNVEFIEEGSSTIQSDAYTPTDLSANQFVHTFAPSGGLKNCTSYNMKMDAFHSDHAAQFYDTLQITTLC